jgi:hypothetical protein
MKLLGFGVRVSMMVKAEIQVSLRQFWASLLSRPIPGVIPANAGIHLRANDSAHEKRWIPAFAGMTLCRRRGRLTTKAVRVLLCQDGAYQNAFV